MTAADIKVGDKVKCISIGNNDPGIVTLGKVYEVLAVDENPAGIDFINDQGDIDWFALKNFEKVTQQPAAQPTGGLKYDSNKPPVDLVPREAIEAAARAFGFGARKYAAHNFKLGLQYSRLAGAVQRHLLAYMDCEDLDPESGLSHLDHAMSALSMLVYMSKNKPEMDDRFNKQTLKLNNEEK